MYIRNKAHYIPNTRIATCIKAKLNKTNVQKTIPIESYRVAVI